MIRVRIPPSPTGLLHIGTARTALYNFLFARHNHGVMVFRSEDTDKERSKKEYEENIISGLKKLGILGDEGVGLGGNYGPYRQSERTEIYEKYLQELIEKDHAYYCFCSKERLDGMRKKQEENHLPPRYDKVCAEIDPEEAARRVQSGESAVIRLRVPLNEDIKFNDLVRGETVISSAELDDFVIARKINDPLYNFTVVIDDHTMEITHVIRGEDHISNTPKQILIYRAFGWNTPEFAHLPLILNEDKSKLSKRKNKVSVDDFLAEGYLPSALINFLVLIGWNTSDEQEIFSLDELIEKFTLERVHKGGAVFDVKKLDWINGEYIRKEIKENIESFMEKIKPFTEGKIPAGRFEEVKKILQDPDFEGRFKKLSEIPGELAVFFNEIPDYPLELIMKDKFKITPEMLKSALTEAKKIIEAMNWEKGDVSVNKTLSEQIMKIPEILQLNNGQVLWPVRAALSGAERSPNFSTLMVYLGKEETLYRLDVALNKIK